MKKNISFIALVLVVGLSCIAVASAGDVTTLRVKVPFEFHVGKALLPAGSYIIQMDRATHASATGSRLVIRSTTGTDRHFVAAVPGHSLQLTSGAQLAFRKYDETYFLSKVSSYGMVSEVIRSKAEKETAARVLVPQEDIALPAE